MRIRGTSPWNGIRFFEWQELFSLCADDIRMIRAPRNNQHSGRSFNGRWTFCMNQRFILLEHQSSCFSFFCAFPHSFILFDYEPAAKYMAHYHSFLISLLSFIVILSFGLDIFSYCSWIIVLGDMGAEVTENTI